MRKLFRQLRIRFRVESSRSRDKPVLVVHGLPRACGRSQAAAQIAIVLLEQTALARSRLYRLFEWSAGVTYDIPRQRMLEAPSTLSNPANDRPIKAIVEQVDFSDATGFSQSVKNSLGEFR